MTAAGHTVDTGFVSPSPLRVRLTRPELAAELADALAAGDCLCAQVGPRTLVVLHRAAASKAEARTELAFFLRAWQLRHADAGAYVV
jgi:hypothetical protein